LQAAADWQVTGLASFQEFGLQFFLAGEPAFWYGPGQTLSPDAVVCHTLALEQDSRRTSYAMLLIEHADIPQETLTTTARWYGVDTAVTAMYQALSDDATPPDDGDPKREREHEVRLPSDAEYAALKSHYGLA
jgi:hypothetical protein